MDAVVDLVSGAPWWVVVVAAASFALLESTLFLGAIVPGDVVVLAAAAVAPSSTAGAILAVAVASGSLAGELGGHTIGRSRKEQIKASRFGRAIGEDRWSSASRFLERHGSRALFGARFVGAIHTVVPVTAGVVGIPRRKIVAWCGLGSLTWASAYVIVGLAVGRSYETVADRLGWITLAVGLVVVTALVAWLVFGRRRPSKPSPDEFGV